MDFHRRLNGWRKYTAYQRTKDERTELLMQRNFDSCLRGSIMLHHLRSLIHDPRWQQRVFVMHSHRGDDGNLLALGVESEFICAELNDETLHHLQRWLDQQKDWAFGFISYDVKNVIEKLHSHHTNELEFPFIHFVKPQVVIRFSENDFALEKNNTEWSESHFREMLNVESDGGTDGSSQPIALAPKISKHHYVEAVEYLKEHIQRGDIYEVNYCQEFFAREKLEEPYLTWLRLNTYTEAPFSIFMQTDEKYLMCASPERFLKREGNKLISQPIKGTVRRGKTQEQDAQLKQELLTSEKERSENVMIVDLVRNDLSRIAERGTVKVDELFGIHTFKTVHHMISTISATVKKDVTFTDLMRALFPMGSMTGAPKVRAMQLIEEHEYSRRGLYSGTVGYIKPNGDFDFNVVIRSLLCNNKKPYIACSVGSAITALCDAEKEYDECLLKAEAVMKALERK